MGSVASSTGKNFEKLHSEVTELGDPCLDVEENSGWRDVAVHQAEGTAELVCEGVGLNDRMIPVFDCPRRKRRKLLDRVNLSPNHRSHNRPSESRSTDPDGLLHRSPGCFPIVANLAPKTTLVAYLFRV